MTVRMERPGDLELQTHGIFAPRNLKGNIEGLVEDASDDYLRVYLQEKSQFLFEAKGLKLRGEKSVYPLC